MNGFVVEDSSSQGRASLDDRCLTPYQQQRRYLDVVTELLAGAAGQFSVVPRTVYSHRSNSARCGEP